MKAVQINRHNKIPVSATFILSVTAVSGLFAACMTVKSVLWQCL